MPPIVSSRAPRPRPSRWWTTLGPVLVGLAVVAGLTACEPAEVVVMPCVRVFGAAETAALDARSAGHHLTASVWDERSHCRYDYNPQARVTTASLFKVSILARVLRRAQDEDRPLTPWEQDRVWPMIAESYDVPTYDLYYDLGGLDATNRFYADWGLHDTVTPSDLWGSTTTSAADQTALMRLVAGDRDELLDEDSREIARSYLGSVIPTQRWGIGAGAPAGWSFVNKNGFFPTDCCRWRVNSSGRVRGPAGSYDVTILSDQWGSLDEGIVGIEGVAHLVNDALGIDAPGAGPFGSLDLVTPGPRSVTVGGWAIDPDTAAPVTVEVAVDQGVTAVAVPADRSRPDVGTAYPLAGSAHGFGVTLTGLEPGAHAVCVSAFDAVGTPGPDTMIGCQLVVVPA